MPISSARANSESVDWPMIQAPITNSDSTGMIAEKLVLSERISTWFIETLTMSAYERLLGADPRLVLTDSVEHDDRVVQRVSEDREEGDHRRRSDEELEDRVDPDADHDVVDHGEDRGDRHPPFEPEGDEHRHQREEDHQRPERLLGDLVTPRGADEVDVDVATSTPAASAKA